MAQKRKNEDKSKQSAKRHKGELPVCQIDGITMAIPNQEMIDSALRSKGFNPAVPFQINRQTGQAFVQLSSKEELTKLIAQSTLLVNGVVLKIKQLARTSAKLYGLRDSFVWRNESLCFFEAGTGLCFDPGQGIYLYWDSVNQVYTRVPGDGSVPPKVPLAGVRIRAAQQQFGVVQQAQMLGQQAPIQTSKPFAEELKSTQVKLEIEKNASNFLRVQFNKIKQEKEEAQKLLKEKDQIISNLTAENKQEKAKVMKLELQPKTTAESMNKAGKGTEKELDKLRKLVSKLTETKKKLQEELQKVKAKVKSKEKEQQQLLAKKTKMIAVKDKEIKRLNKLLAEDKSDDDETQGKIKLLEADLIKWKSNCNKLKNEAAAAKKELSKESSKTKVVLPKIPDLENVKGSEITITPILPETGGPSKGPITEESKRSTSTSPKKDKRKQERNEALAKKAEEGMLEFRMKFEGFGELFSDIHNRVGKLKNTVKLNSMEVEHNMKSVKPEFNNLLGVLKRVSGICQQATGDLEKFNAKVLSTKQNPALNEITDVAKGVNHIAASIKELDDSFKKTQPTFGVLAAEVEWQKADIAELKKQLKEAKTALKEEKSRREDAEDLKVDLTDLKKMLKKKKRRRRDYSRSRSTSRSRSSSYPRRR